MRRTASIAVALVLLAGCGGGGGSATTQTTTAPKQANPVPQPATTPKPKPTPRKAPPAAKAVGIGDQGTAYFAAPLFQQLGIDKARRVVPWDAMSLPSERALTDQWLAAARTAGV